jgi:CDP-ribitol ribitolphosphotransferase
MASTPAARAPSVELRSIDWIRFQLVVELAGTDPALRAGLQLSLDASSSMPPTNVRVTPDGLVARFNVMLGPHQEPLEEGTWFLSERRHRGSPVVALELGAAVDLGAARRSFATGTRLYVAEPVRRRHGLGLRISVETIDPLSAEPAEDDGEGDAPPDESRPTPLVRWVAAAVRHLRRVGFRLVYRAIRVVSPRNGRRIVFSSNSRSELGGNLQLIHDRMLERGLDRSRELAVILKQSSRSSRTLRDRLRLAWLLARADCVVIDDYQRIISRLGRDDAKIIQVWHAFGTFKTFGFSAIGTPGAPSPWSDVHKNYTWATVGSHRHIPWYAEAFGIPERRVVVTGVPRTDLFLDAPGAAAARERTDARYPAAAGRRLILFAPTYRGVSVATYHYDVRTLDYPALHAACEAIDAVFVVRLHSFIQHDAGIPDALKDRLIDASSLLAEDFDLLRSADVLITDYSSVFFEFSLLRRPMLFFAPDLDEYLADRGFYVDYEPFVPGKVVRSASGLAQALRDGDFEADRIGPFVDDQFELLDGHATDRVVDLILSTAELDAGNR